jgi:ribosomal protein S18 acetylase RimI-like enzyme
MSLRLRPALPQDDDILARQLQALNEFEWAISRDRRTDLAGGLDTLRESQTRVRETNGDVVVAQLGEEIVGHLILTFETDNIFLDESVRHYGYVSSIFVDEKVRGRGVGKALMVEAERLTEARGLKRLMLYVLHGNSAAQAFYSEFGFRPLGIEMMKAVGD